MKKTLITAVCALLVFLLVGCGAEKAENGAPVSGGAVTAAQGGILKEPPELTVSYDGGSLKAQKGTYSWAYRSEGDTWAGINADSAKWWNAEAFLLRFTCSAPQDVKLQWDVAPDRVSARCWSKAALAQGGADEAVPVRELMLDVDTETEPVFIACLKGGGYLYEVVAEWDRAEDYYGTACYGFYVAEE